MTRMLTNGCPFGTHRVISPPGVLPQPADKIDNNVDILWDNEILIDVDALNIDSASFTQIKQQAEGNEQKIRRVILDIVEKRGKMHNPVTGSGGMLIGRVAEIGGRLRDRVDLKPDDRIATLVSLSLTPLKIECIEHIDLDTDQVVVKGRAILFEKGLYARLPDDIPPPLALAVLDVAGAPAQTARLVAADDTVVVLGATGKSGILCCYMARKQVGPQGMVIGIGAPGDPRADRLEALGVCDHVVLLDATDALGCYREVDRITGSRLADLVINCVNVPDTEQASILMCRDRGKVYFFSMATAFTKAALGAEGVGKDIDMLIGNGYTKGHAELALGLLRESEPLRQLYQTLYGS